MGGGKGGSEGYTAKRDGTAGVGINGVMRATHGKELVERWDARDVDGMGSWTTRGVDTSVGLRVDVSTGICRVPHLGIPALDDV